MNGAAQNTLAKKDVQSISDARLTDKASMIMSRAREVVMAVERIENRIWPSPPAPTVGGIPEAELGAMPWVMEHTYQTLEHALAMLEKIEARL